MGVHLNEIRLFRQPLYFEVQVRLNFVVINPSERVLEVEPVEENYGDVSIHRKRSEEPG